MCKKILKNKIYKKKFINAYIFYLFIFFIYLFIFIILINNNNNIKFND